MSREDRRLRLESSLKTDRQVNSQEGGIDSLSISLGEKIESH